MQKPSRPTKPIPIRLDDKTTQRVDRAAKRLGSNRCAVIRLGLLTQLDAIEAGVITLPRERKGTNSAA